MPPASPSVKPLVPSILDPNAYSQSAPLSSGRFSREWGVTFRRWGMFWPGFFLVSIVCAAILGAVYPSPDPRLHDLPIAYYSGLLFGLALIYLALFGWWLDHILAGAGWVRSLLVQAAAIAGLGLASGTGGGGTGDPDIGFPGFYFGLVGALGVAVGHAFARKVRGSFEPREAEPYPSSAM